MVEQNSIGQGVPILSSENEETSELIAIELNDNERAIKYERSQWLSTSPDKTNLIASAT